MMAWTCWAPCSLGQNWKRKLSRLPAIHGINTKKKVEAQNRGKKFNTATSPEPEWEIREGPSLYLNELLGWKLWIQRSCPKFLPGKVVFPKGLMSSCGAKVSNTLEQKKYNHKRHWWYKAAAIRYKGLPKRLICAQGLDYIKYLQVRECAFTLPSGWIP